MPLNSTAADNMDKLPEANTANKDNARTAACLAVCKHFVTEHLSITGIDCTLDKTLSQQIMYPPIPLSNFVSCH
ncbi:Uncharacterised protein [Chlamydia trachomatis]|nr:Uncharacterised protein [Chlamydia trachomatis]